MHCSPYLRCSPFELVSCRTNHSVAPDKSQWCCQQRARRTMQRRGPIWKWIGRSPTTRRSSKHLLGLRLGQRPPAQQRRGLGRCLSAFDVLYDMCTFTSSANFTDMLLCKIISQYFINVAKAFLFRTPWHRACARMDSTCILKQL